MHDTNSGYESPEIRGGNWRILKWYIFRGLRFFEIYINNYLFVSLYLYFIKIWWKSYIFHKFQIFFRDPCFYATIHKFRLPDYVILLHATILCMILKDLVSVCSQQSSFLRKADACNHKKNKYLNGILFLTFWNQTLF